MLLEKHLYKIKAPSPYAATRVYKYPSLKSVYKRHSKTKKIGEHHNTWNLYTKSYQKNTLDRAYIYHFIHFREENGIGVSNR